MNPRRLEAAQGWRWITNGFMLFRRNPLMWVIYTLVLGALGLASVLVPLVGPLLFNLFSTVLLAGLLLACRAQEQGEVLTLAHLFSGFRSNVTALVTIGGINMAGTIIIVGLALQSLDPAVVDMMRQGRSPADPEAAMQAMRSMGPALLLAMALYMPLMMAVWFAPALIVFDKLSVKQALMQSFTACLHNLLPFLIYGGALVALGMVASIPLLAGLVLLMPVIFCSIYMSYKDIYAQPS